MRIGHPEHDAAGLGTRWGAKRKGGRHAQVHGHYRFAPAGVGLIEDHGIDQGHEATTMAEDRALGRNGTLAIRYRLSLSTT